MVYVILSRVTTLDGVFLTQPLKPIFNPKPTKFLQEEWRFQCELETETLFHLQKFGNFPQDLNICTSALNEIIDVPQNQQVIQ
jgi:hypothetical protein